MGTLLCRSIEKVVIVLLFAVMSMFAACSGTKSGNQDVRENPDQLLNHEINNIDTGKMDTQNPDTNIKDTGIKADSGKQNDKDVNTTDISAHTDSVQGMKFTCPSGTCSPSGEGPKMDPGQNCNNCHRFRFAGTVYGPDSNTCGSSNQGVPGVQVEAIPANGGTAVSLGMTNCVGNFMQKKINLSGKVHFRITYTANGNTWTKTMKTNIDTASPVGCASCHTSSGSAGSPVHL